MSEKNEIITLDMFNTKIGWFAQIYKDNRVIICSDVFARENMARSDALQKLEFALYGCNHNFDEEAEHSEHNEHGQTEYVLESRCIHCGLVQNIVNERSIYDSDYD